MENKNTFNKEQFAQTILYTYIKSNSIEKIHSIISKEFKTDANFQEKKLIIENCFNLFKNPKIKQILEKSKNKPELNQIIKKIIAQCPAVFFSDNKRIYDMSNEYSNDAIDKTTKLTFEKTSSNASNFTLRDEQGNIIILSRVGTLNYKTAFLTGNESIDKFKITFISCNDQQETYDIFSNISFSLLSTDENYRYAVLNELLNKNNIQFTNASGYIGEVEPADNFDNKLEEHQQQKSISLLDECYIYQPHQPSATYPKYVLAHKCQPLSAVMDYVAQQNIDQR